MNDAISILNGTTPGMEIGAFTAQVQNNFQTAASAGRPIYIPAGEHRLNRKITVDNAGIFVYGAGKSQSALRWVAGAASSGLEVIASNRDVRPDHMQFQDFMLLTEGKNVGTALRTSFERQVNRTFPPGDPTIFDRFSPRLLVRDVAIRGATGEVTDGWNIGIDAPYSHNVFIDRVLICGYITGPNEGGITMLHGIRLGANNGDGHPTGINVRACLIQSVINAIDIVGMEGGVVAENNIVGVVNGVRYLDPAARPGFFFANNHVNAYRRCVQLEACSQAMIVGNLLYHTIGATNNGIGVSVAGPSQHVTIIGNQFESASPPNRAIYDAVVMFQCDHGVVDDNTFRVARLASEASNMNGIVLGSNARFIKVGDRNVFEDNRSGRARLLTEIADGGISNFIPDLGARFVKSNAQFANSGTLNIVNFESRNEPTGNPGDTMEDGAFVIPSDGIWQFTANVLLSNEPTGQVTLNIQRNAVSGNPMAQHTGYFPAGVAPSLQVTTGPKFFRRNEVIRVGVNPAGAGRTILNHPLTYLEARRVS